MLRGYDYDHTLTKGIAPEEPWVVITGRTLREYDTGLRQLAQRVPVYLRGSGIVGDHVDAGNFKAMMINHLGVGTFYEDNDLQIAIIRQKCPDCTVIKV